MQHGRSSLLLLASRLCYVNTCVLGTTSCMAMMSDMLYVKVCQPLFKKNLPGCWYHHSCSIIRAVKFWESWRPCPWLVGEGNACGSRGLLCPWSSVADASGPSGVGASMEGMLPAPLGESDTSGLLFIATSGDHGTRLDLLLP